MIAINKLIIKTVIITSLITTILTITLINFIIVDGFIYHLESSIEQIIPNSTPLYKNKVAFDINELELVTEEMNTYLPGFSDIKWYMTDLDKLKANGVYPYKDKNIIILNENLPIERAPHTILHEYSHYLLNSNSDIQKEYKKMKHIEKEELTDTLSYLISQFILDNTFTGNYITKRDAYKNEYYQELLNPIITELMENKYGEFE